MLESLAPLAGFALGLRHALEPDHVSAVGTLATERDRRGGMTAAAFWGAGHAMSLVALGLVLAATRAELGPRMQNLLEAAVGATLVLIGSRLLWRARAEMRAAASAEHAHGDIVHAHAGGGHAHVHVLGGRAFGLKALSIGLLHGFAGSSAVTAAALGAGSRSLGLATLILVAQAIGTLAGMVALSCVAGPVLRRLSRSPAGGRALLVFAGLQSCVLGVVWASRALGAL